VTVLNVRVDDELKRKLAELAKRLGASQSDVVKGALTEKLIGYEAADAEVTMAIPEWVPDGKYAALVRGAVAAVGDSVADVVATALSKFRDEPIHVARKGKPIETIHYTYLAQSAIKCWKYVTVDAQSFPILPTTVIGRREVVTASVPDTASSLTLASHQVIHEAGLEAVAQETIFTPAGPVRMKTFKAAIELPIGRYETTLASSDIPKELPFQTLLGRNLLDLVDLYALGKIKVVCIRDP